MSQTFDANYIKDLIKTNKIRKTKVITKEVANLYLSGVNFEEFCGILGDLALTNLEFFMQYCYGGIQGNLVKAMTADQRIAMDKLVVERFCLFQGEFILASWTGMISQKKQQCSGRIFLTNYRLICTGQLMAKSSNTAGGPKSLLSLGVELGREARRQAVVKSIRRALSSNLEAFDERSFGTQFPITDTYNIKKKKDSIGYSVDLEYDKKGKQKQMTLILNLSVYREKGEDKIAAKQRQANITNIVEETLLKARTN